MFPISGHHHISMIVKDAHVTNDFYTKVLGLRRVKVTVNQDDPSMYHLFYGDLTGSPGADLTFFEMPMVGQTYRGTNAITRIGLVVSTTDSLSYWKKRFENFDVTHSDITTYFDRPALHFEDPDGLQLIFIVSEETPSPLWEAWEKSPVPVEHQMKGMGPIEITVRQQYDTVEVLQNIFNYEVVIKDNHHTVLQSIKGEIFGEIVVVQLDGPKERPGRGSIHHVAIRAKNDEELKHWDEVLKKRGYLTTGIVDRHYFKSVYFRDLNGIMFEIATDEPGFTVTEPVESLGEKLDLPPFLEDRRAEIVANLKPIA